MATWPKTGRLRKGRLNANNFGVLCKAVERNSYPTSLFKRLLGLGQFDLSKVMSVQWGTDHEYEAAHFYATRMAQFEVDSVEECGL